MATLWIREGYQAEFERKICSYTDKITEINDQFYKTSKIIEVYSGDPNVNSCNVYLDKRRSDLSNALHSAEELKRKANSYVDQVIGADISVSKSIHKESYEFYQKKGIGPQNDSWGAHLWNSVKTTVSDFVHDVESTKNKIIQDIKEFYEKSKYIFNVIGDFLAVAAAVALFSLAATSGLIGILCLIGAIWATSKAMYELITDCLAVEAWLNGDEAKAERLANRKLTEDIIHVGEWIDEKLGISFFENTFKAVLIGLEICELVLEVVAFINVIKSCFNLTKLRQLDHKNLTHRTWNQSLHYAKMTNWFAPDRFGSALNWAKFALVMTGYSIDVSAQNTSKLFSSFAKNAKKNKYTFEQIKIGNRFNVSPIGKMANSFAADIANIIMA